MSSEVPAGPRIRQNNIPRAHRPHSDAPLLFSFSHLHDRFVTGRHLPEGFMSQLLVKLKELSSVSEGAFKYEWASEHRNHQIAPESRPEMEFENLGEQLQTEDAYQFCVDPKTKWRVYGILVGNVFYIRWLDPDHVFN
jgi:hypothetical protein